MWAEGIYSQVTCSNWQRECPVERLPEVKTVRILCVIGRRGAGRGPAETKSLLVLHAYLPRDSKWSQRGRGLAERKWSGY